MFKDFGISEEDWNSTPQSVKTALTALEAKEAEIEGLKTEVLLCANASDRTPLTHHVRRHRTRRKPVAPRAVRRGAKNRVHKSGIRDMGASSSWKRKLTAWLTGDRSGVAGVGIVCKAMIHDIIENNRTVTVVTQCLITLGRDELFMTGRQMTAVHIDYSIHSIRR